MGRERTAEGWEGSDGLLSHRLAGLVCALVGLCVYLNTLDCGLCFDDKAAIIENNDLRPDSSWANLLWNDFWGVPMSSGDSHKSYRPLCVATFRLNYLLHELEPMGYHVVNILLHGVVCYLYVQLCGLVLSEVWPALIAGLLFAVHPIHTEAVSGLVGRADVLSALFSVLAVLAYRRSALSSSPLWLAASLTFALCGALSKETGLTVVGVCVVYEYFIIRQMDIPGTLTFVRGGWRRSKWVWHFLLRVFVLFGFSVGFLTVRLRLNQGAPVFSLLNNPALFFPAPFRQLHWAYLSLFNLQLLLNPAYLCAEYAMNTIPPIRHLTDPRIPMTFALFLAVTGFAVYSFSRSTSQARVTLFALSLMVFPYLPASNLFFPVGFVVAERVLYLPSMGLCLLVAHGVWSMTRRVGGGVRVCVWVGLLVVMVVFGVKTVSRNRDWQSDYSLFRSAVKVTPNNVKLINNLAAILTPDSPLTEPLLRYSAGVEPRYVTSWMNLAEALRETKQPLEAIKVYRRAADLVLKGSTNETDILVTPSNHRVFNSLSNMLREHTDNDAESLRYATMAITFEPEFANSHHTKGKILLKMQRYSDAKPHLLEAVRLNPTYAAAHSNLGEVLFKLGEMKSAVEHLRSSLKQEQGDPLTMFRLANTLAHLIHPTQAQLREAEDLLLRVLELEPTNGNATFCLGLVYFDLSDLSQAEVRFLQALDMSPGHPGTLYNLGVLLSQQERFPEAIQYLEQLTSASPSHTHGLSQLGTVYLKQGQRSSAVTAFNNVLKKDPSHLQALQNLGVMMIQDNNIPMATKLFSHLHELKPADSAIKMQLEQLLKRKQ